MKKKEINIEVKFLSALTAVVLLLGAQTMASILQPFSTLPEDEEVASSTADSTRSPASIANDRVGGYIPFVSQTARKDRFSVPYTLQWKCNGKAPEKLMIPATHLRLKGEDCANFPANNFVITNKSNGFTAAVFPQSEKEFSTDFIDLKDGENHIHIDSQDVKGESHSFDLTIVKNL